MTLAPSRDLGLRLTLLADDSWCVVEPLGEFCYVPDCNHRAEAGSHHVEPRSRTGGPRQFVVIDQVVVRNQVKLCTPHHRVVTGGVGGHRARVTWLEGAWVWQEVTEYGWQSVGLLERKEWDRD